VAFALKREAVDGEAIAVIIVGLNGILDRRDADIARELVLERVQNFSEIMLGWKTEDEEFRRAIGGLCGVCPDDVNLSALS
jgi:hypothetical protein